MAAVGLHTHQALRGPRAVQFANSTFGTVGTVSVQHYGPRRPLTTMRFEAFLLIIFRWSLNDLQENNFFYGLRRTILAVGLLFPAPSR